MDHRAASIQFIKSTGLIPVRVRPRQKDAYNDWDPRLAAQQDHRATLAHLSNGTDDNLAALFAGRYIDIDVDSKNSILLAALDHFLPTTQFVWGRASKPRSHRTYQLPTEFDRNLFGPMLRYLKSEHEVEVRGGKQESGLYSVLPGSIHPTGEEYQWEGEVDPSISVTIIPVHVLLRSMRLAIAASIIASYWQPGSRNDLALAVSGLLWRIRASSLLALGLENEQEVPDDKFVLTHTGALNLFEAVMLLAGDDSEDRRSRLLSFGSTWKKLDADSNAKVSGGKVLASLVGEGDGNILVKHLYRLLSDNPDIEQMEKLVEQFVMWYGPGIIIDLDMIEKGRSTPWMTKEQATNSLAGNKITFGDKRVPAVNLLFNSQSIRRVAGLTFDPSTTDQLVETAEGTMINQWRGFEIEPCPQMVTEHEVQPFLDYIKEVIADGSKEMYDWVMGWIADLFQRPHEKPGTALVLVGVQGAGKSFLGEKIIGAIIGKGHAAQINSITQLTDKFNTIIDNKIFVQCDEAVHSYQRDIASRLKSVITDGTVTIEPKGVNSFRKPNHMHLLFTSNEEFTSIFIDASPFERRFTVAKVSEIRAQDIDYWVTMHKWVKNNLHKIMRWLLDWAYDKDFIRRPLNTEAKENLQRMGLEPEISWIVSRVNSGFLLGDKAHEHWWDAFVDGTTDPEKDERDRTNWPTLVSIEALEKDLREFIRGNGRPVYSGSLLTTLRRVFPPGEFNKVRQEAVRYAEHYKGNTRMHVQLYSVPSKASIAKHINARYGKILDAEEDVPVNVPKSKGDLGY